MENPDGSSTYPRALSSRKAKGALILLAAYLCALMALSIDLVFWTETPLLAEGVPNFSDLHSYRTVLIALSAAFTVVGLSPCGLGRPESSASTSASKVGKPFGLQAAEGRGDECSGNRPNLFHWGILSAGVIALLLFIGYPKTFLQLQIEDQVVEVGSALFLFTACFVTLQGFWRFRKSNFQWSRLYAATALLFMVVFFLICMEEISWFQRVLSVKTPSALSVSPRDELNLHNLATDLVETAYYGGAFVFLVLLPFLYERTGLLRKYHYVQTFLPSGSVLLASSLAMAYNYDMWNILFTQLAFFLTLFILVYKSWAAQHHKTTFVYLALLIVTFVMTQGLFLAFGDRFTQGWEVTEYKELLIPIAFLLYATEVHQRARAIHPAVGDGKEATPAGLIPSA
jgi:hypothetical protein